jgi:Protein of unknown function (DUF2510)
MSTVAGQHEGIPVPEPGWYTDPHGTGDRWWDGQAWTEHTQAAPAPVATAWPAPPPAPSWTPSYSGPLPGAFLPVVKNTQATVGLVISLVAIPAGLLTGIWFASLIGALVSSRGLRRAKVLDADGYGPVGKSVAIWGAVLGLGFYALGLVLRIVALNR